MTRNLRTGVTFTGILITLGVASAIFDHRASVEASTGQAPRFEVDPMWPKPLPNHWIMGNTIGVSVDSKDHIWIIHRQGSLEPKEIYSAAKDADGKPAPAAECCIPAPPVL